MPAQFGARILSGAFCGAVIGAAVGSTALGLAVGAAGAVAGTLGGAEARSWLAAAFGVRPAGGAAGGRGCDRLCLLHPRGGVMIEQFDAIVIGGGQAGPPLAVRLAGAGMRTAIVERKHLGGTCVNTGCRPTKTLVASAYAAHLARRAAEYGVAVSGPVGVDMAAGEGAHAPGRRGGPGGAR